MKVKLVPKNKMKQKPKQIQMRIRPKQNNVLVNL
jgi:hypothetical protein